MNSVLIFVIEEVEMLNGVMRPKKGGSGNRQSTKCIKCAPEKIHWSPKWDNLNWTLHPVKVQSLSSFVCLDEVNPFVIFLLSKLVWFLWKYFIKSMNILVSKKQSCISEDKFLPVVGQEKACLMGSGKLMAPLKQKCFLVEILFERKPGARHMI